MQLLTRSHKKLTRKNHRKSHLKYTKKSCKKYQLNKIQQKGGAAAAAAARNAPKIEEINEETFDGKWSLPIISQFSPDKQRKDTETQIEEYFKKYIGNEHIMRSLNLMLQREHLHSNGEWQVFYHSYADAHILFDVQTALYELIYDLEPDANRVILRLFNKEDFYGVDINSIKSQLNNITKTSNRNKNIRKLLLSAVCSIFISIYNQNFTDIFVYGYTCDDINYTKILTNIFLFCGIDSEKASYLIKKILESGFIDEITKQFYIDHKCARRPIKSSNGQLLQIFVEKSILNKITYISKPYGIPDKLTTNCNIDNTQARILLSPEYLFNSKLFKIYRYAANEQTYKNRGLFIKFIKDLLIENLITEPANKKTLQTKLNSEPFGFGFGNEDEKQFGFGFENEYEEEFGF